MAPMFSRHGVLKGFDPMFKVLWNEYWKAICLEILLNKAFGP